jgi:pimeloyl-ACP methyl ester carboxylesterase
MTPYLQERAADLCACRPHSHIIQTRGGPLEYAVAGEGPAVLALHGGTGGCDQGLLLAAAVGALGGGYTVLAPSRPGYLGTPLASGPAPEDQADRCADLLDALEFPDAAAIAVSGGGPCAINFALRHGDRCRTLVLVSACSGRLGLRLPLRFPLMKLAARFPAFNGWMARRAERNTVAGLRRAIPDPAVLAGLLADADSMALVSALQRTLFDRLAQRIPGTENDTARFNATAGWPLEKIAVPVLAAHGTADRVVAFAHAQAVAARVPRAELLAIAGGGHMALFTHRNRIGGRVSAFLSAGAPPAPGHS